MQKVRQVLFNRDQPNFKEAPDVTKVMHENKQRLKSLVTNLMTNFPMTKESLPDAQNAIKEFSRQYSNTVTSKPLLNLKAPRCEDFFPRSQMDLAKAERVKR